MDKNILLATCGLVPNVVSETFYELTVKRKLKIDNVIAIASKSGADIIHSGNSKKHTLPLFGEKGALANLCSEYEIDYPSTQTIIIHDKEGNPIEDVVSEDQIVAAADSIFNSVRKVIEGSNNKLHCIYSGGRRFLAVSLNMSLSLLSRRNDHLYYVRLEPEKYLNDPNFFYPTKSGEYKNVQIILNEIPLLKIGERYSTLISPSATFSDAVKDIQKAISVSKPAVTVDDLAIKGFVYNDPKVKAILKKLNTWAKQDMSDINILIYGERGSGKEGLAKYFHERCIEQNISTGKFISVNCAGFVESTIGPELFGTKKGKYTGVEDSRGMIEAADGGVLFLDEFHQLDIAIQPKLLRLLEYREYQRIGDPQVRLVKNLKILLGMNEKPDLLLKNGSLRFDLYDRIRRRVSVPPLRERQDLEAIILFLIDNLSYRLGKNVTRVSPDVLLQLKSYRWSGNIRELRNTLETALEEVESNDNILMQLPSDLLRSMEYAPAVSLALPAGMEISNDGLEADYTLFSMVRDHIEKVLRLSDWNVSRAAEVLDMKRTTLQAKMKKHNITLTK